MAEQLYKERWGAFVNEMASGCWEWTGSRDQLGYGRFQLDGRAQMAHRVGYELLVGPIPVGLELDHLCRNKSCVNPAHLEPVTRLENVRRWAATITQCPSGHPYDETNTRPYQGRRYCRACSDARSKSRTREYYRAWRAARKAKVA